MFPAAISSCTKKLPKIIFNRGTRCRTANAGTTFGKFKDFVCELLRLRGMKAPRNTDDAASPKQLETNFDSPSDGKEACRVCLKVFKPNESKTTCSECASDVCKTCTSCNPLGENPTGWKCNHCIRKKLKPRPSKSCLDIPEAFLKNRSKPSFESTTSLDLGLGRKEKLKGESRSSRDDQQYSRGCLRTNTPYMDASRSSKSSSVTWQDSWGGNINKIPKKESGRSEQSLNKPSRRDLTHRDFVPSGKSTSTVIIHPGSSSYREQYKNLKPRALHLSSELLLRRSMQNLRRASVSEYLDPLQCQTCRDPGKVKFRFEPEPGPSAPIKVIIPRQGPMPAINDDSDEGASYFNTLQKTRY